MARIRSLKPEIVEDQALGRCSIGAQLTFDRLITQADDHGRFRASPELLKGKLFPYLVDLTTREVGGWVDELVDAGVVRTYTVRQQDFGYLTQWAKHQRIDNAAKPLHPGPDEADGGDPPRTSANRGEIPPSAAGEERKGEDRSGSRARAREDRLFDPDAPGDGPADDPVVEAYRMALPSGVTCSVAAMGAVAAASRELRGQGASVLELADAASMLARNGGAPSRLDIELAKVQRGQGRSLVAIAEASAARLEATA